MRKQQLLQLHRLVRAIRHFLEDRDALSDEACASYDALNVGPTNINRSKDVHRNAITTLLADLNADLTTSSLESRSSEARTDGAATTDSKSSTETSTHTSVR